MKHLSITCVEYYTCHVINYVHVENNSSFNSMNSTRIQNGKTQLSYTRATHLPFRLFNDNMYTTSGITNRCPRVHSQSQWVQ